MKYKNKKHKPHPALYSFFSSKKIEINEYALLRNISKDMPSEVKERLEWIIFYETIAKCDATKTANYFNISRKTFHKWYNRFKTSKRKIESLKNQSKAPIKKRTSTITHVQEYRIKDIRKKHMKYGKHKIKRIYEKTYGEDISTWHIEKTIRKFNLFFNLREYKRTQINRIRNKHKKKNPKILIKDVEIKDYFGFLWHIDAIVIDWYGQRRYIVCAIEHLTRIAYARVYSRNTSSNAQDFLKRLMYLVECKVEIMHSDNGSEFKGSFETACNKLNIKQVYSRARTPTDNPMVERFNWTVQDEWLSMSEVGLDDVIEANYDLTRWLKEYNIDRPHESLDYRSPMEYVEYISQSSKVLPMYPARTIY